MKRKLSLSNVIYYTMLSILALVILIPMIWLVSSSFDYVKSYSLRYPPSLFPKNFSFFNYEMAVKNIPILKYLSNTIIIAVLSSLLNVIIATLTGFCLSKGKFPGKTILLFLILTNMMIPFETKLMPVYQIIKTVGLSNSLIGVVLPSVMTNAMYIFFVKTFCDDLPYDLYEAGVIDGAGKLRIFSKIYFPLLQPIIATIVVLDVINIWNDLLWPMIVLNRADKYTVQIGLVIYNSGSNGTTHAGTAVAVSMLSVIPLAIIFIFMQRYIVQSIAFSGVKE